MTRLICLVMASLFAVGCQSSSEPDGAASETTATTVGAATDGTTGTDSTLGDSTTSGADSLPPTSGLSELADQPYIASPWGILGWWDGSGWVSLQDANDPVTIDAATQPGYQGEPLIELDGSLLSGSENGLRISGGASFVRGLAIPVRHRIPYGAHSLRASSGARAAKRSGARRP